MMPLASLPDALTAVPVGVAFGFVLERAGLGDPRVIRGQLLLRDFTVVRVMFGAIVTAMLGVLWLGAANVLDTAAIAVPPTDLAAQVLGAVIFGGGFALAALCPGTACVAAASGRRDGAAAVTGVLGGTLLLPLLWPVIAGVVREVPDEAQHLYDVLPVSRGTVALAVTALAIAAMRVAERVEGAPSRGAWWQPSRTESATLALALAFAAVDRGASDGRPLATIAGEIAREEDHVEAVQLAEWIRDARPGLRVVEVRDAADTGLYAIPGAERVALLDVPRLEVAPGDQVVLYSDGGAHAAQAWVLLRARGLTGVKVLRDGLAAWEDEILAPVLETVTDSSSAARVRQRRDLSRWFGGLPRAAGVVDRDAPPRDAPRRRRRTC